jgi:hypothetical protein
MSLTSSKAQPQLEGNTSVATADRVFKAMIENIKKIATDRLNKKTTVVFLFSRSVAINYLIVFSC